MNLNNLDDLDALLESKYENDLKDQIEEFEEGNGGLDSLTFDLVDSNSLGAHQPSFNTLQHSRQPLPLYQPLLQQQPQMQNFQQMLNMPLNQNISMNMHQNIQHNVPLNMQNMMPQHVTHSQMPQPLHHVQPLQMPQGMVSVPGMMTMEDVENLLKAQSVQADQTRGKQSQIKEKVMTVEDVESLLKAQLSLPSENKPLPSQVSEGKKEAPKEKEILSIGKEKKHRVHLEKIKRPSQAERRKNKNVDQEFFRKDSRDSREENKKIKVFIMNWEKELIAKIQISQLVSDDPMRDDFYCQIYTQNSSARKESMGKKERGKKKSAGVNKIQQQMTRLIEKRKTKEVKGSISLEGALGKISVMSSRNPRQVLSLDSMAQQEKSKVEFSLSPKSVLSSIERVYGNVLELEALKRIEGSDTEQWEEKFDFQLNAMWENLGLSRSVSFSLPHPFGFFLKFSKGIKVIPRILKFLSPEQQLNLFSTLMCRLECVEIANLPVSSETPEIEVFMAYVIPPFVDYVSEIGLDVVNSLMKTVLERHNMVWVATSKIGLAFLTAFLSRAELLKQGASQVGGEAPNENDLTLWNDIYNFLFSSLQGSFSNLFPTRPSDKTEFLPGEMYTWQFLASLAICATNVDQQTTLVTEVRDNIIATAKMTTDPKALANVDLFLTALGLGIDASQLALSV